MPRDATIIKFVRRFNGSMTALRNILLSLSIGVIVWMASCSNNGCEENSSSLPLAGFYSSQTKRSIAVDSLTVYGIGSPGDSAIIRNQSSTKQVYLPFDVDADCSRFVIQYNQQDLEGITDTVTVSYDRVPFFYSKDCGAFYLFDVTDYSVSHNLIDSIQVPQRRIDNTNTENIKIFFRTGEAGAQ